MTANRIATNIPLGRYGGIPMRAHWSVLVIVALLTVLLAEDVLPTAVRGAGAAAYWATATVTAVVLMATLFAHELAHAIVARRFGVRVTGITLWALGGMTTFEDEPPTPRAGALVAAAGPAASLVLGGAFLAVSAGIGGSWLGGLPLVALSWLAVMNVLLGLFNLLPAAPLDGGRLLRAWLWSRSGDRDEATAKAAAVGQGLGFALVAIGMVTLLAGSLGGLWLAFVGWFLTAAANAERQQAQAAGSLRGTVVRDVMTPHPVIAPGWWTVGAFATHLAEDGVRHRVFPVLDFAGRPVGVVTLPDLAAAGSATRVHDAARPLASRSLARAAEPLADVLRRAGPRPAGPIVVTDGGHVVGILTATDIARTLELGRLGVTPGAAAHPPGTAR